MSRLALGLALLLSLGCGGFGDLRSDDPQVSEQELHRAGLVDETDDLGPHLLHVVRHRADYRTEQVVAAVVSLARRAEPGAARAIAPLATDADEELRYHVARALVTLGGPHAQPALARLRKDASPLVRDAAGRPAAVPSTP